MRFANKGNVVIVTVKEVQGRKKVDSCRLKILECTANEVRDIFAGAAQAKGLTEPLPWESLAGAAQAKGLTEPPPCESLSKRTTPKASHKSEVVR